MEKKTYGVYGFIEYEVGLDIGGRQMNVSFTQGSITQQGVQPARFTTTNRVVQYALEQHRSFKSGRIRLLKSVPVEDKKRAVKVMSKGKAGNVVDGSHAEEKGEQRNDEAVTTVEVGSFQDALDYLKENFGLGGAKVHSKAMAQEAALQHGVRLVIKK